MAEKIKAPLLENIIKAYKEGLDYKLLEEKRGKKGLYSPEEPLIELYLKEIDSKEDYDITIMHEFFHHYRPNYSDEKVERSAQFVVKERPEIVDLVKEIFELPEYESLNTATYYRN